MFNVKKGFMVFNCQFHVLVGYFDSSEYASYRIHDIFNVLFKVLVPKSKFLKQKLVYDVKT